MKRRERISAAGSNSLIRYLVTGGLNTCLAYAYFYALYGIIPLSGFQRISTSLYGSMAISVFVSYSLQKRFVWKDVMTKDSLGSAEKPIKPSSSLARGDDCIRLIVFGVVAVSLVYVSAQTTNILDSHLQVDPRISQLILTPPLALASFWVNRKIFTGRWR
jgi:putative flippase GtrA